MKNQQNISLPDGRILSFLVLGEGMPVLYFHGTASSRLETLLLKEFANDNGFEVISVDRPGCGLSTYVPRNSLRDFNSDINYLMTHLGLEKFALLAWSGGGPFGLAYVSHFPARVTKAVIVGSPALPFEVATAHNHSLARFALRIPAIGIWGLKRYRTEILSANIDIKAFLESRKGKKMIKSWPKEDAKFFANLSWIKLMYQSIAEAFRQKNNGLKAVFQEHQLFIKPWNEPVSRIPSDKVHIWHGTEDTTCRVDNAYRICEAIPNAHLEIFNGKGHCVMFDNLQKLSKTLSSK